MKKDISLISKVMERDPEYPERLTYPSYTHKHTHGNSSKLVWVCEDCGYDVLVIGDNCKLSL